jgi:ATPase family AAA domain-containing protein 1
MTHWDGLVSANSTGQPQRICILGATNRIQDIDDAILRRMPKKFAVPLPSAPQRRGIFNLVLAGTKVDRARFDLDLLVKLSAGLSGSDIKEACRDAAMIPMREVIRRKNAAGELRRRGGGGVEPEEIRGVTTEDFFRRQFDAARDAVPLDEDEDEVKVEVDGAERPKGPSAPPAEAAGRSRAVDRDAGDDPAWTDEDSSDEERRRKKGKKDRR